MGNMVGVGWPADIHAGAVLPLSWIYRAFERIEREGRYEPRCRRFRHHRRRQHSDHQPIRYLVGKPTPKASITLGGSSIDQAYLVPLFVSVAGFSLLFGALVLMRMRTALAEMRIEARMRRMADY